MFRFEIPSVRVTANKRGRKSTASPLNHFRFCVSPFNYATSFGDSRFHGYTNFLVEAGGELRARGSWTIGIEHPTRSCTLANESIGTSGTYRRNFQFAGRQYSHLIDPRTGRPVTHHTVSVSVIHADCADADAWGAALNVMGVETGLPLAERLHLAAQFVVERSDGKLDVQSSAAWKAREAAESTTAPADKRQP